MKLLMTGASGFLGAQLVPMLAAAGVDLVLVGRDPARLKSLAENARCGSYEELRELLEGVDAVMHLAVLNNTAEASEDEFRAANVELTRTIAEAARAAKVPTFINVSSFHALDDGPDTPYARSKREAIRVLSAIDGINIVNLFLPAVHGERFAGKLAVLEKLPKGLRRPAFAILSALAPTVSVKRIAGTLVSTDFFKASDEPMFPADPKEENLVYRLGRGLIDYGFALSVILLFWWLLAIIWVLVKTGSPGPGIFAQDRVGKGGKVFVCYKFRSMAKGTKQAGTHEVSQSSVTPIGNFIRKTKIDELPQVWNILKGELSLVGPRPCLPVQTELVHERTKRGVLTVLPGITGLAQIKDIDMSDPVRLSKKDAEYIARRGLLLELKIIIATFTGKGRGDRVAK
ncbi:hybrid nucleoside-diphosphate sugar epimerase/sugar transferase [Roseibium sp. TrichSKD4]|uniref:hybrid nucleoside-diphosphate sugar epimerase/sugar transferase n=1 Tax=Roseibium sp. TrichSKD4 TaxID=744980 RepID=UPI001AD8BCAC|nr:hybrid nucleoside-diphosphate sugar epimerase/sugar transferase [Roseibium sp. TrichSKD4]